MSWALVSDISAAGAILGCVYLLVAAFVVRRFRGRPHAPVECEPPVTILKPLHGAEPELESRLRSFCDQSYGAPLQVICGLRDHADPAAEAVRLAQSAAGPRLELTVDPLEHGSNRKVSNLVNMARDARHEILIVADSDIEVGRDYLANIVALLGEPGVGAVTCLYHGVPAPSLWSRHAALAINAHFLPSVVLALTFGLAQPCFGSTIAMRRSTLCGIGGFQAFADCLADDHAIGMAIRSAGHRVSIPSFSLGHCCFEESLRSLFSHELRAARTIRRLRPFGHCGSIVTHPFPLALIDLSVGGDHALVLIAAALACRALLCESVRRAFQLPRQPHELIPIRDLLSFAVFVTSFFGKTVKWRGSTYTVCSDGRIVFETTDGVSSAAPAE
jgi:ceramide glucosyltransferase